MMGSISLSLERKRILTLIKRSKYKGAMLYQSVLGLLPGDTSIANRTVRCGSRGLVKCGRGRVRRVQKRKVTVIFRSPRDALGPAVAIKDRVRRTVLLRRGTLGRGGERGSFRGGGGGSTGRQTVRLVGLIKVGSTRRHCSLCPCRFSNKVHREYILTATLTSGPGLLVTSRPAATLSIAVRTRVLGLLGGLRGRLGLDVLFVARSLKIITRVTSQITMVRGKGVIRLRSTGRLFATPGRSCAGGLLRSRPCCVCEGRSRLGDRSGLRRGLMRVSRLSCTCPLSEGEAFRTMGSISFRVEESRVFKLMNRSKSKGSAIKGYLVKVLGPRTRAFSCSKVGLLSGGTGGGGTEELRGRQRVVFRSSASSLGREVGMRGVLTRPLRVRGMFSSGGRRRSFLYRVVRRIRLRGRRLRV